MRKRHSLIVVLVAVIAVSALSVTGQEEPLPKVTPRASTPVAPEAPSFEYVALSVEPARVIETPTLADAVRRNDYLTFNALYTAGKAAGENVSAYDALHELWSWSMNDPVGAFYGSEVHDRLARAYPGFAAFINEYRIVDSRGAVFYPTSETRTFLLARALEGRAPKVLIADAAAETKASTAGSRAATRDTVETPASATVVAADRSADTTPVRTTTSRATREIAAVREATARTAAQPATPVTLIPAPPAAAEATTLATTLATTPESTLAPAIPAIADATAERELPTAVPAADAGPATVADDQTPIARDSALANRGILLLVLGIIGIGLLAVMLRTPADTAMPSILQQPPAEKAAKGAEPRTATVEPIERAKDQKRAS